MSQQDGPAHVLAQQVALYGEPLAARFARLLAAYRIPQSRLARTIGLSAPMLSQLASGRRVKISNPAVYARLLRLEELASTPAVASGDPARLAAALDEVVGSQPDLVTGHAIAGRAALVAHLVGIASPGELAAAAAAVPATGLAELLDAAALAAAEARGA